MGGSEGKVFVERKREWGRTVPRAVACQAWLWCLYCYCFWMCLETGEYYLFVPENSTLVTNSKRARGEPLNRPLF